MWLVAGRFDSYVCCRRNRLAWSDRSEYLHCLLSERLLGQQLWIGGGGASYYWTSLNTSIATISGSNTNPSGTFLGQNPGTGTGQGEISNGTGCNFVSDGTLNVLRVQITLADITQNKITVVLSGPSVSGNLNVQVTGPNGQSPIDPITNSAVGPGTYNYSFGLNSIPIGEYTTVTAAWTVNGSKVTTSLGYHFKVMGTYVQTQYNTPAESSCGGSAQAITIDNASCGSFPSTLLSNFVFRVSDRATGTGSGYSNQYNVVKPEVYCTGGYSTTTFRENSSLVGALGGPLNNSTVAINAASELAVNGTRVFIVGEGVKTVTDLCGSNGCPDLTHLDNYNTSTQCSGLGSLPSALTIHLY